MLVRALDLIERLQVQILAGVVGEFSAPESTLCADSLSSVHSNPVLLQWHVKDPSHSTKKRRWQVIAKHP